METLIPWILLFCSVALSWLLTAGVKRLALRLGVVAKRNSRRRHERDTPLLGGAAFYIILTGLAVFSLYLTDSAGSPLLDMPGAIGFIIAITVIFGVGVIDDYVELKAPPKVTAQLLAAVIILVSAPRLPILMDQFPLPVWVTVPVLILWIVGVTNAINLIDGLDGLCAGVVGISALCLMAIVFTTTGVFNFPFYLTVALVGSCVGFLFHNFNPAKIFLGDSGSLLLGFVLAVISIKIEVKRSLFISLSLPMMILALPLLDVVLSVIRRRRLSRSIFQGDRGHIHHRLQQVGLSQRSAVLVLWVCTAYLNVSAFFLAQIPPDQSLYIYASVLPTMGFGLVSLLFLERRLVFQAAKFSHLFIKQEDFILRDRARLVDYVYNQVKANEENGSPFTVVVIDCAQQMVELASERPRRVVDFYVRLYGILKTRLRGSDLIARVGDHRFVTILAGVGRAKTSEPGVIQHLSEQVRELQEEFAIFIGHPARPEGFKVLHFPKDASRIWSVLHIRAQEIHQMHLERRRAA
jgi:UDP-GlcNAc:undecaprenyl-phosphate/decaprenyl-phosphate GlcNAc-1-phosphate transferase